MRSRRCCCPCLIHQTIGSVPGINWLHPRDDSIWQQGTTSMGPGDTLDRCERSPDWYPLDPVLWINILNGGIWNPATSNWYNPDTHSLYLAYEAAGFVPPAPGTPYPSSWGECCKGSQTEQPAGTYASADRDGGVAWSLGAVRRFQASEGNLTSDWLSCTDFGFDLPWCKRTDYPEGWEEPALVRYAWLTDIAIRVKCASTGDQPVRASSVRIVYDGVRQEGGCNECATDEAWPTTAGWVEYHCPRAYDTDGRLVPVMYAPADTNCETPIFFSYEKVNESDFGAAISAVADDATGVGEIEEVEILLTYSIIELFNFYGAVYTPTASMRWLKKPNPHGAGTANLTVSGMFMGDEPVYVVIGYDAESDPDKRGPCLAAKFGLFEMKCVATTAGYPDDTLMLGMQIGTLDKFGEFSPLVDPCPAVNTSGHYDAGLHPITGEYYLLNFTAILSLGKDELFYELHLLDGVCGGVVKVGGTSYGDYTAILTSGETILENWTWVTHFDDREDCPAIDECMWCGESYEKPTALLTKDLYATVEWLGLGPDVTFPPPTGVQPASGYGLADLVSDYICPDYPYTFTMHFRYSLANDGWASGDWGADGHDSYSPHECEDWSTFVDRWKSCVYPVAGKVFPQVGYREEFCEPWDTTCIEDWWEPRCGPFHNAAPEWTLLCSLGVTQPDDPDHLSKFILNYKNRRNWECAGSPGARIWEQDDINIYPNYIAPTILESTCKPLKLVYYVTWYALCSQFDTELPIVGGGTVRACGSNLWARLRITITE